MTKSRTLRKAGAVVLSLAMAFSVASINVTPASAAASLSKKTVSVKAKKKTTVKVKGINAKTKVTVKAIKKAKTYAKVTYSKKTQKLTITGKKKGTAKFKIKVGKKTFTLTVKVKKNATKTDDDGTTVTESLKVVDLNGYQTDGTAIVGDKLQVQVPASIGTIDRINWYIDDKLVSTSSTAFGDGSKTDADDPGKYVARVVTTKGTTYSSDAVTVSATELRAVLSDFAIEDDYTDKFIDFTQTAAGKGTDAKALASITFNKEYSGTIDIYESKDGKFVDKVSKASLTTKRNLDNDGHSDGWTNHEIYVKSENGTEKTKASITHNADASVTYKWFLNGTLTRGTKYVAVFNQDKVVDDDVKATEPNKTAEVEAPYVTQPKSITLGPIAKNMAIPVNLLDEAGNKIDWLGVDAPGAANVGKGSTQTANGIESVKIYADKDNTVSTKSTTVKKIETNVIAGVVKSANNQLAVKDFSDHAWYVGEVVLKKGVYGADKIPLTSVATNTNAPVADKAVISESTTDAKNAEVAFTNLAADATVYLLQGTETKSIDDVVEAFDAASFSGKSVEVVKGAKTATIEGAFSAVSDKAHENDFAVVVVPKDESNFGRIKSDTTGTDKFTLKQKITKYALQSGYTYKGILATGAATYTITGEAFAVSATAPDESDGDKVADYIQVNDQFGNRMKSTAVSTDLGETTRELTFTADATASTVQPKLQFNFAANKKVTVTITGNNGAAPTKAGLIMTATDNKTGQTFTLKTYKASANNYTRSKSSTGLEDNGQIYYELTLK